MDINGVLFHEKQEHCSKSTIWPLEINIFLSLQNKSMLYLLILNIN